ncbi:hypothetical protein ACET3Z_029058 [Daucus carota]
MGGMYSEAWVYNRLGTAGAVLLAKSQEHRHIMAFGFGVGQEIRGILRNTHTEWFRLQLVQRLPMYPAAHCGVTALRPAFGTVGRTGVNERV